MLSSPPDDCLLTHFRFLYTRILLFRHMVGQLTSQHESQRLKDLDAEDMSVEQSTIVRGAIVSTTSAQELISLIYEQLVQGKK